MALFADAFVEESTIFGRLFEEISEASREFRQDPSGYIESAIKGDSHHRRRILLCLGVVISAVPVVSALVIFGKVLLVLMLSLFGWQPAQASAVPEYEVTEIASLPNDMEQEIEMPKADKKAGGGGGGGRETKTPPSKGQLPEFSLKPPIIAPRPEPRLTPPVLPTPETVQVDPRLQPKRDDLMPTGLPTGIEGPPSAGPGTGGGMGSGSGGGMGSGDGTGVGPGRGYNMGGGDPSLGGGTNPDGSAKTVDSKPVLLNRVQPLYTEEARKNKIQGVVRARVLIGADGRVKRATIVTGLPDGLNEMALQAAHRLVFKAATKNGQPVAFWMPVVIEFNIR
ncbi:MAG TPA: energy transducer TonB [Blastocatellia bacterium]|nr:energy transducer TonB [Blastocatellia bacterium]